jgi:hypothetical protein
MCVLITMGVETESQYWSFTTFFFFFSGCYLHILLHTLNTIIWHNELFTDKGLKEKHMIFVGLFHSNAGKNVIYNFSSCLLLK